MSVFFRRCPLHNQTEFKGQITSNLKQQTMNTLTVLTSHERFILLTDLLLESGKSFKTQIRVTKRGTILCYVQTLIEQNPILN